MERPRTKEKSVATKCRAKRVSDWAGGDVVLGLSWSSGCCVWDSSQVHELTRNHEACQEMHIGGGKKKHEPGTSYSHNWHVRVEGRALWKMLSMVELCQIHRW